MGYIFNYWKGIIDYKGRTTRKEFWIGYFGTQAVVVLAFSALSGLCEFENFSFSSVFLLLFVYGSILIHIPGVCRRLRDAGFSMWVLLLIIIPAGFFVLFILLCMPTEKKKIRKTYDKNVVRPVIRCSICTGEQVAGFKNRTTGEFTDIMIIRSDRDLEAFIQLYQIEEEIPKEY